MSPRANRAAALVLFVAAVIVGLVGSSTLQAFGWIIAVVTAMVVLTDLLSPRANRLHIRYRGRYGVKSWADRRSPRR
jgi:uncharacterized oligopeptide transporter (OPT) family protein